MKYTIGIIIIFICALLSGCMAERAERTYVHAAPQNYTEFLTLYPDGTFTGVFYEDRYFPQIPLSGTYRDMATVIILRTPTGHTITFTKSEQGIIFEGDTWAQSMK